MEQQREIRGWRTGALSSRPALPDTYATNFQLVQPVLSLLAGVSASGRAPDRGDRLDAQQAFFNGFSTVFQGIRYTTGACRSGSVSPQPGPARPTAPQHVHWQLGQRLKPSVRTNRRVRRYFPLPESRTRGPDP